MRRRWLLSALVLVVVAFAVARDGWADESGKTAAAGLGHGVVDPDSARIVYRGTERLRYTISYTGGIKLGELEMQVRPLAGVKPLFEISVVVTTADSIFDVIYPVRDIHLTRVAGAARLPGSYEAWLREGYNYRAHRRTEYDQQAGVIRNWKNDKPSTTYQVSGVVHNEFSAFLWSRIMEFSPATSFLVPTFADKRRSEVEVRVLSRVRLKNTVFGAVETFMVSPVLPFRGLYDKRGPTTLWYTDDECRVPVQVRSELKIGSVTAALTAYDNPLCRRYGKDRKGGRQ
ncbi:MAG: DUF3108 domain-containing protein [Desulfopila sp.]